MKLYFICTLVVVFVQGAINYKNGGSLHGGPIPKRAISRISQTILSKNITMLCPYCPWMAINYKFSGQKVYMQLETGRHFDYTLEVVSVF